MPFNAHIGLRSLPTWPVKSKSPPTPRSRQTSVDLTSFGVPSMDDPDPFGVRALEQAGLLIKEAGSQSRPSSDAFEFRPSPNSPVFRQSFQSTDAAILKRDSRRDSKRSTVSVDHGTQTADLPSPASEKGNFFMSPTQMAAAEMPSPIHENERIELWTQGVQSNHNHDESGAKLSPTQRSSPLRESWSAGDITATYQDAGTETKEEEAKPKRTRSASQRLSDNLDRLERESRPRESPVASNHEEEQEIDGLPDDAVVVEQVVQAAPAVKLMTPTVISPTVARAKLVTIKGRPAPALPVRNPARQRRARAVNADGLNVEREDESSSAYSLSPTRSAFDRNDDHASNEWSEQTSLPDESASVKSQKASLTQIEDATVGEQSDAQNQPTEQEESAKEPAPTTMQQAEAEVAAVEAKETSLASTVALALSPTNDSQLSNHESLETKAMDDSSYTAPATSSDASTIAHDHSTDPSTVITTAAVSPAAHPDASIPPSEHADAHDHDQNRDHLPADPLEEKSPATPHAIQGPFSNFPSATNALATAPRKDSEIASVSDYGASLTSEREGEADEEPFHSMPVTPLNEAEDEVVEVGVAHVAAVAVPTSV